jgi:hypothetical protein
MGIILKIWNFLRLPTGLQLFVMRRFNDQFLIGVTGIFIDDKRRILLLSILIAIMTNGVCREDT